MCRQLNGLLVVIIIIAVMQKYVSATACSFSRCVHLLCLWYLEQHGKAKVPSHLSKGEIYADLMEISNGLAE